MAIVIKSMQQESNDINNNVEEINTLTVSMKDNVNEMVKMMKSLSWFGCFQNNIRYG